MKKTSQTLIDKWFIIILSRLIWENKILRFTDLIDLFKSESVSTEHIFLLLHKSNYIGSHKESVEIIQANLEAGLPTSFNHLKFHVNHDEAYKFIRNHPNNKNDANGSNQLTFNL